MGLDFSALIQYGGPSREILRVIARLERGDEDVAFQQVVTSGLRRGFAFAERAGRKAAWRPWTDIEQEIPQGSNLPSLDTFLDLPSDFSLTFGHDTVWVYHTLRWLFFVTEAEWQRVMLTAMGQICELLKASDCVITNDCHPAISAFRDGASFAEALEVSARQGEGEVSSLSDLYREVEDDSELALKPGSGPAAQYREGQVVLWPRDKPLPDGWSRPTVWESKGFWRFR
jgi:hypothetical protein